MEQIEGTKFAKGEEPRRASERDFEDLRERRTERMLAEIGGHRKFVRDDRYDPSDPDFRKSTAELERDYRRSALQRAEATFSRAAAEAAASKGRR